MTEHSISNQKTDYRRLKFSNACSSSPLNSHFGPLDGLILIITR